MSPNMNLSYVKHIAAGFIILGTFIYSVHGRIESGPYYYDEADYMYAASLGIEANALDSPSRPLREFIDIGMGARKTRAGALSQVAREGVDVNFYRHTHGPFYSYWLILSSKWTQQEHAVRNLTLITFPLLTALAVYLGCLWIASKTQAMAAAVLGAALYLWSPAVFSSSLLGPHLLFPMEVLISLFCVAKAVTSGSRWPWYAAVVAAGLAFATLEVAFVLVATLIIMAYVERSALRMNSGLIMRSLVIFVTTVLIVWPAAVLKLSFLKSYMFMAYLATFRKASWGDVSLADTWKIRFGASPVEWLLIAAAIITLAVPSLRKREAFPFLLFGGLMTLTMFSVRTGSLRYALPFLPALHVMTGLQLAGLFSRFRPDVRGVIIGLCVGLLAVNSLRFQALHPMTEDVFHTAAVITDVERRGLTEGRLLVPQVYVPTLHYYFPKMKLTGFADAGTLVSDLETGQFDSVLYPGRDQFQP
jgi:hypothetical protein